MDKNEREIIESVLGAVDWKSETDGYCECPGKQFHTKGQGHRDAMIRAGDGKPPTLFCFHASCEGEVAEANKRLRSELGKYEVRANGKPVCSDFKPASSETKPVSSKKIRYVLRSDAKQPIPDEIEDGARKLIRAAFREGEGVRIVHAGLNDEGDEVPSAGLSFTREDWLRRLDAKDGHVNDGRGIFSHSGNPGVYVAINPIQPGETKDSAITDFRHALLEFDDLDIETQWAIYRDSDLPITAVIHSGKRSLHAWVRVDAKDRREYDERVAEIYDHFADYRPDVKNKNPGRLSRLAGCVRFDSRQRLLALDIGKASFSEWMAGRALDGVGEPLTIDDLLTFDASADPNSILGERYLCKGGALVLVAPSGVGKSTLATQFAFTWALGIPAFGIAPARPLRSLILQAENDAGDIAEQVQGAIEGIGINPAENPQQFATLRENVVYVRDTIHTADAFCSVVAKLVDRHRPDIVWIDPLLSFLGGDVSKQEVCSRFLRNGLNPIAEATGVVFVVIHHTGKPPKDAKSMSNWTSSDYAYLGSGSSEITNWARAVMVLQQVNDDGLFSLMLSKRGGRAGATDTQGKTTTRVFLRHGAVGIRWEQVSEPPPEEKAPKARHAKAGVEVETDEGPHVSVGRGYDPSDWLESIKGVQMAYRDMLKSALDFAAPRGGPRERRMKTILGELRAQGLLTRLPDGDWIFDPKLF